MHLEVETNSSSDMQAFRNRRIMCIVVCSTVVVLGSVLVAVCFKHDVKTQQLYFPGSLLEIEYDINLTWEDNVTEVQTLNDTVVLTYFNRSQSKLYSCGHCLPIAARARNGCFKTLSSSGFGVAGEGREIAEMQVAPHCISKFRENVDRLLLRQGSSFEAGERAVLHFNNSQVLANVLFLVNSSLSIGWISTGYDGWEVEHTINNLDPPFVFLLGAAQCPDVGYCIKTEHGYSGSPWTVRRSDTWELIGPHIGRARARRWHLDGSYESGQVAYAKHWPLTSPRQRDNEALQPRDMEELV